MAEGMKRWLLFCAPARLFARLGSALHAAQVTVVLNEVEAKLAREKTHYELRDPGLAPGYQWC